MESKIPVKCVLHSRNNDTTMWCIANSADISNICKCQVNTNPEHNIWTITSWFTKDGYNGNGIGRKTLYKILIYLYRLYGKPVKIEYIWNGTNEYVFNWLVNHFDAKCECPLAVQKYQADDDWLSHVYELNIDKVLEYFNIK